MQPSFNNIKVVNWVNKESSKPLRPTVQKTKNNYSFPTLFQRVTDVLFDDENIPNRIVATYGDDYDITHIHEIIIVKLEKENRELPFLQEKKVEIEEKLDNRLKVIQRKKITHELEVLNKRIDDLQNNRRKNEYIEESKEYLRRYQEMGPVMNKKSFMDEEVARQVDEKQLEERIIIIRRYLDIAKKYIPINVIRIVIQDQSCPGCGGFNLLSDDPEYNTLERCQDCGYERLNFGQPSLMREGNLSTKTPSNSDYEDRENFVKALECYLGEQPKPPENLFLALDNWAYKYEHPSKEEISQFPINSDGTRGVYGKEMLIQALGDEGYADYYKDWKLIGHLQWSWELPKIGQQDRDMIVADYDGTQKIFNTIKGERKSSMNTQLRLYRHLEARSIPCHPSDFKLPTTPGILEEQDIYWREMIKAIPKARFTSLK